MPTKRLALVTAVAALAAAGCGSSNNSTHSATVSPAPTPATSSAAPTSAAATSSSPASSTTTQSAASATSTSTSSAAGGAASTGPVKIAADPSGGLKYIPSTATASAGKVTIDFTNASAVPHNINIQEGTNGKILGKTATFSHGSKTLTVTLKAGKYTYFCSVPGHRQAGMLGTLTVK